MQQDKAEACGHCQGRDRREKEHRDRCRRQCHLLPDDQRHRQSHRSHHKVLGSEEPTECQMDQACRTDLKSRSELQQVLKQLALARRKCRKGSASPSNASLLRRRNIEGAAVKEGYQQTKLATPKPMSIDVDIPELLERPRVVPTTIEGMPTNPSRQLALDQATAILQGDSSVQWAMPTVTAQNPIMFSASLIQEAMPPARGRYVQPAIDQQEAMPPVLGRFGGCLLYTSPSPRDRQKSRMPSSA